jgi:sarcosine oxidase subunit delta
MIVRGLGARLAPLECIGPIVAEALRRTAGLEPPTRSQAGRGRVARPDGIVAAQGVAVAFQIDCPNCGRRPYTEFTFGDELRDVGSPDVATDFARVYLPANAAGPQRERWFHALGCRRWLAITRDTVTNRVDAVDPLRG